MEFIISQGSNQLILPVPPESFEISTGNNNTTLEVENLGEINLLGKPKLATISISSFFPAQKYYFYENPEFVEPYECVNTVNSFMKKGKVKLMISGTNINNDFYIESFVYGENDGTGDVNYTIEFKEYRKAALTVTSSKSSNKAKTAVKPRQGTPKAPAKTYKVKAGDCLYNIAKKVYGDASKYKELAQKNNIKNYKSLKVGTVLKL